MSPILLVLILLLGGALMLFGELMLPTHGVLGVLGAIGILMAVGYGFTINVWLAVSLLAAMMALTPFAWTWAIRLYPRTPFGRRMVLPEIRSPIRTPGVQVGADGKSLTALRPVGECEFSGARVEAQAEIGVIEPGNGVRVVAIDNGKIIVRPV